MTMQARARAEARRINHWRGERIMAFGKLRSWTVIRTTGDVQRSGYFRVYLIEPDGALNGYGDAFHVAG
mgnify:CR=1 FL=1